MRLRTLLGGISLTAMLALGAVSQAQAAAYECHGSLPPINDPDQVTITGDGSDCTASTITSTGSFVDIEMGSSNITAGLSPRTLP